MQQEIIGLVYLKNNLKSSKMKATKQQTAVGWLYETLWRQTDFSLPNNILEKAKAMEKEQIDNKVIHFAEWLTKKHTTVLMTLYEQFEEQYYNKTYEKQDI